MNSSNRFISGKTKWVFVYSVSLANEGCQNKVWGFRSQLFTKENRQMKEKDSVERQKGRKMWERQKGEIESEIRGNRNAVANFLSPTGSSVDNASWQPASPGRHPFYIVNKRFKGKCQLRNRKSSFSYNISFLLPADAAAQSPGKWQTRWVMRMAHTTCSIGGDSNRGWHHSAYRSSRPCGLTPYLDSLLSRCVSEIDLAVTYKWDDQGETARNVENGRRLCFRLNGAIMETRILGCLQRDV